MHIREDVIWKKRDDGSMLYNTRTEERMTLNGLASNIFLSRYVNHFDVDEIAESISHTHRTVPVETIHADVASLVQTFETSQFFTEDDDHGFVNLIETRWQIDSVVIEVTGRCNLSCRKVMRAVLTGGETFMRRDVLDIVRAFDERTIRTIVFTTGTLVAERDLDALQDLNVLLRFSLDGVDGETHDAIRGEGTFDRTMRAIEGARARGIDIGLSFTLTQQTFDQFWPMLQLADRLGVRESEISDVRPVGSAGTNGLDTLSEALPAVPGQPQVPSRQTSRRTASSTSGRARRPSSPSGPWTSTGSPSARDARARSSAWAGAVPWPCNPVRTSTREWTRPSAPPRWAWSRSCRAAS